jgi:hypothetical protein
MDLLFIFKPADPRTHDVVQTSDKSGLALDRDVKTVDPASTCHSSTEEQK